MLNFVETRDCRNFGSVEIKAKCTVLLCAFFFFKKKKEFLIKMKQSKFQSNAHEPVCSCILKKTRNKNNNKKSNCSGKSNAARVNNCTTEDYAASEK